MKKRLVTLEPLWIGGVILLIYLLTLSPDLAWAHHGADGGDLVTAAVTGRVPHPPGFPLYTWLASVFVRVPWGTPAWRLNLLSALSAAGAAVATTATAQQRNHNRTIAAVTGLTLGCAPLLWSQAVIAEVYAPATCLTAVLLWWRERSVETRAQAAIAGLLWGLGIAVHPTLLFLAPLWLTVRRDLWPVLLSSFALGLTPYTLLPLHGPWPQPWGDLRTLDGWWTYVSARLYHGFASALPLAQWPQRWLAWAALLARQFSPVGAAVALLGVQQGWRKTKPWSIVGPLLALLLVSIYAVGYNTTDSLVYLTSFLPVIALWLSDGIATLAEHRIPPALWLLLPALLLALNWATIDLSNEQEPHHWAETILNAAPPDAVLVTSQDAHTFTLWYAQEGWGLRPDVVILDRDLWAHGHYRAFLEQRYSQEIAGPDATGHCDVKKTTLHCP